MEYFEADHNIDTNKLFKTGEKTLDLVNKLLTKFNKNEIKLKSIPPYKRIFIFFLTRSIKSFSAVHTLCQKGYGQDIATLLRALLENLISSRYILSDLKTANQKAERFVDYKWIVYRRYISNEKNNVEDIKDILMKKLISRKDTVNEKYLLFKEKYKLKSDKALITWSGRSIRDMAKMVDKDLLEEYDSTFRLASRFSHPSIIGDRSYIQNKDNKLIFSPFPSSTGVLINYRIALKYILFFLKDFNRIFKLDITHQVEDLISEFNKIPEDIPPTPKPNPSKADNKELILQFQSSPHKN